MSLSLPLGPPPTPESAAGLRPHTLENRGERPRRRRGVNVRAQRPPEPSRRSGMFGASAILERLPHLLTFQEFIEVGSWCRQRLPTPIRDLHSPKTLGIAMREKELER